MAVTGINLISTKTDDGAELTRVTSTLKKISYGAVLTLLVTGIALGGAYTYMQSRITALTSQKTALTQSLATDAAKEGILRAVKDRITVIDKLTGSEKHLDKLFSEISLIGSAGTITSISLDEANKVVVVTKVSEIGQAIVLTDTLIKEAQARKITKPLLTSMTLDKTGGFNLSLSFVQAL